MTKEYIADKATLDNVNSIVSALNNRWPDARAGKVDNIQAVLNTPNGDTLAAWLKSISDNANAANSNAANAYNKANDANNNAANAANLASQANSNAWNAYQEAMNAKNAAGGSVVKSVQRGTIILPERVNTATATISAVNTSKSIVLFGGSSVENFSGNNDSMAVASMVRLMFTAANQITATRYYTGGIATAPYQVIEFY